MTKPSFIDRCTLSEQCLPDAPYRAMLRKLHKDMLNEIARLKVLSQPAVQEHKDLLGEIARLKAALEQALTRPQKRYAELEAKAAAQPVQPAQPAPVTLISSEQHIALREAFAINSADLYFEANPTHDNDVGRMLFERGFARGFDSHERAIEIAKKGRP